MLSKGLNETLENTSREFSKIKKIIHDVNENFSRERESTRRNQTEILELKNSMKKMKTVENLNSRIEKEFLSLETVLLR